MTSLPPRSDYEHKLLAEITTLKAAIRAYMDDYVSRNQRQEAIALEKLRAAAK